jgi:transcriptional regulator with XRE-family HTH domain
MQKAEVSQRSLAVSAGISYVYLNLILQGHNEPSFAVCERLAKAIRVPLADLFQAKRKSPTRA